MFKIFTGGFVVSAEIIVLSMRFSKIVIYTWFSSGLDGFINGLELFGFLEFKEWLSMLF